MAERVLPFQLQRLNVRRCTGLEPLDRKGFNWGKTTKNRFQNYLLVEIPFVRAASGPVSAAAATPRWAGAAAT